MAMSYAWMVCIILSFEEVIEMTEWTISLLKKVLNLVLFCITQSTHLHLWILFRGIVFPKAYISLKFENLMEILTVYWSSIYLILVDIDSWIF